MYPIVLPISKLMKNILTYYNHENNILVITEECFRDVTYKLFDVKVRFEIFTQAFEIAVNETLGSISLKLPPIFGNIDIAVDDEVNREMILEYLAEKLIELITVLNNPNANQDQDRSVAVRNLPVMDFNKLFASTTF